MRAFYTLLFLAALTFAAPILNVSLLEARAPFPEGNLTAFTCYNGTLYGSVYGRAAIFVRGKRDYSIGTVNVNVTHIAIMNDGRDVYYTTPFELRNAFIPNDKLSLYNVAVLLAFKDVLIAGTPYSTFWVINTSPLRKVFLLGNVKSFGAFIDGATAGDVFYLIDEKDNTSSISLFNASGKLIEQCPLPMRKILYDGEDLLGLDANGSLYLIRNCSIYANTTLPYSGNEVVGFCSPHKGEFMVALRNGSVLHYAYSVYIAENASNASTSNEGKAKEENESSFIAYSNQTEPPNNSENLTPTEPTQEKRPHQEERNFAYTLLAFGALLLVALIILAAYFLLKAEPSTKRGPSRSYRRRKKR